MDMRDEQIREQVLTVISGISGYSIDELEMDMFLEADMGLDSIKMVDLMGRIIKLIPEGELERFTERNPVSALMQLETIEDLVMTMEQFFDVGQDPGQTETVLETINEHPVISKTEGDQQMAGQELQLTLSQYTFLASYYAVGTISLCSYVKVIGALNVEALTQSWQQMIYRNPALQGRVVTSGKGKTLSDFKLRIHDDLTVPPIAVKDMTQASLKEREEYIQNRAESAVNNRVDLTQWPLHHFEAVKLSGQEYVVMLTNTHLISDGIGNQKLLNELMEGYANIMGEGVQYQHRTVTLNEYNHKISQMNQWDDAEEEKVLKTYINNQGRDKYIFEVEGSPATKEKFAKVKNLKYSLTQSETEKLFKIARENKVSLFVLLVAVYARYMGSKQKSETVIINLPTGGRVYPNVEVSDYVGCFAQNVCLSFKNDGEMPFADYIQHVNTEINKALLNGYDRIQTKQLVEDICNKEMFKNGEMDGFTASFIRASLKSNLYLSFVDDIGLKNSYGNIQLKEYHGLTSTNTRTIDNLVEIFNGSLQLSGNYDEHQFQSSTIHQTLSGYMDALKRLEHTAQVVKPSMAVGETEAGSVKEIIDMLNEITHHHYVEKDGDKDLQHDLGVDSLEKIRLISRVAKRFPKIEKETLFACATASELAQCIGGNNFGNDLEIPYQKIIEQCQKTPEETAILFEGVALSYRELDQRSNQIAHFLKESGVERNQLVGLLTNPGPLMTIGIMGILKAGGAYVPVDPNYPVDRIQYMVAHSEAKVILTEHGLKERLQEMVGESEHLDIVAYLDSGEREQESRGFLQILKSQLDQYSKDEVPCINAPEDLMIVIYTSGSTGNPKGVMLNHKGYMNRLIWHQKMFEVGVGDRVAQKTSCCFDVSVWELFWPLMYGATQCPVKKAVVQNPWALAKWLQETHINVMHFVPSLFGEFINAIEEEAYTFKDLKWLIFSGEALPMNFIQKWMDKYGTETGLSNLYGPTEASIDVTYHMINERPGSRGEDSIPIGQAVDAVVLVNVDEQMNRVPKGEMGELCLGGIQLAYGYLKDIEKTEKAFKKNPFSDLPCDVLYKTGDLVIEKENGVFEYHGRVDNQIKIRGFRVELGEIESVIYKTTTVKEAAVVDIELGENNKKIVACISGGSIEPNAIQQAVSRCLPEYMVPHFVEQFESLPKNANGKVDRKALKKQVLSAIGGGRVQKAEHGKACSPVKEEGTYPLAPAQKWLTTFFDAPYRWTGYNRFVFKDKLDIEVFEKALGKIVEKHDVLRMEVVTVKNKLQQKIHSTQGFTPQITYLDGAELSAEQIEDRIQVLINQAVMKLGADSFPLWSVFVIKLPTGHFDISIVGHHLISDVLTNQILFNDLWVAYAKLLVNEEVNTSLYNGSYIDYLQEIMQIRKTDGDRIMAYWLNEFPSEDKHFLMDKDFEGFKNTEESAAICGFKLSHEKTNVLLKEAKKYYRTSVYPMLLAGLYKSLSREYNSKEVIVAHRVNGREIGKKTYFDVAGDFAVNFPMSIVVDENMPCKEFVAQISDKYNAVPLKGVGYDLIAERLPSYMYPDNKLTSVRANYLGNREEKNMGVIAFKKEHRDQRYSVKDQKRISEIEVFFYIENKQLNIEIEYSKALFNEERIQRLGNAVVEAIGAIVGEAEGKSIPLKTVEKRVVLVTGASKGIGKEIAQTMAGEDSVIVILAQNRERLEETKLSVQQYASEVMALKCDVKDIHDVDKAIQQVLERYGKIDVLINNAGITEMCALSDSKLDNWMNVINTNLIGVFNMCYKTVPHMIKNKSGKIINIGSDSSFIGYPLMTAYAASKHGVLGLTKALSEELKIHNINVNCVCPAIVDTDMAPKAFKKKAISPRKVANVVDYLASERADAITGEAVRVYGNQDMNWFGSEQMMLLQSFMKK